VWVINPRTLRLIQVGKPTYVKLLADGVLPKTAQKYHIAKSAARWADIKPGRNDRQKIYDKYPDMFMLAPNSDLTGKEKSFNLDDWPKYPISTVANPGVPHCQGIKSALTRLSMNKTRSKDPAAHKHIYGNIMRALDCYCQGSIKPGCKAKTAR
jgi:hypothetical protein